MIGEAPPLGGVLLPCVVEAGGAAGDEDGHVVHVDVGAQRSDLAHPRYESAHRRANLDLGRAQTWNELSAQKAQGHA
ncbi:hypothetical protein P9476_23455, partial [Escherichia coli]